MTLMNQQLMMQLPSLQLPQMHQVLRYLVIQ